MVYNENDLKHFTLKLWLTYFNKSSAFSSSSSSSLLWITNSWLLPGDASFLSFSSSLNFSFVFEFKSSIKYLCLFLSALLLVFSSLYFSTLLGFSTLCITSSNTTELLPSQNEAFMTLFRSYSSFGTSCSALAVFSRAFRFLSIIFCL